MLDLQIWLLILLVYGVIILFDNLETRDAVKQVEPRETNRKIFFKMYRLTMSIRFLSYALLSFLTMIFVSPFGIRVICFLTSYAVSYQLSSYVTNKYRKHLYNKLIEKGMSDIAKSKQ